MNLREEAERIYFFHWRKKAKAIAVLPKPDQIIVLQHLRNIGRARIIAANMRCKGKKCWFRQPSCEPAVDKKRRESVT